MKSISLCLLLLLIPALSAAETLLGRVVKVVEGDTVYVLDASRERHKIRLAGIDAPERKQPFGKKSKDYLVALVAGKDVQVDWSKHDRYGRIVGKVVYNGRDVDLAMVQQGYAWWYRSMPESRMPEIRCCTKRRNSTRRQTSGGCGLNQILCRRGNGGRRSEPVNEQSDVGASGPAFSVRDQPVC